MKQTKAYMIFSNLKQYDIFVEVFLAIKYEGDSQRNLLEKIMEFDGKSEPRTKKGKMKKINDFDSINALYQGWELSVNASRSGIFPLKPSQKILNKLFRDHK